MVRPRKSGAYAQIVMTAAHARLVLDEANCRGKSIGEYVNQISNILLEANLTPLQAQAILVRSWGLLQENGTLTPILAQAPSQADQTEGKS